MSKHFQGQFGSLFENICEPSSNFEGNWPEARLILTPAHSPACALLLFFTWSNCVRQCIHFKNLTQALYQSRSCALLEMHIHEES